MLSIQYIGLLNTDRKAKGPVQMFIEGGGLQERYVLDRLPPWIEELFRPAQDSAQGVRYMHGANLEVLNIEAREALHRHLVEGGYKVRRIGGGHVYLSVGEVFRP